MYLLPAISLTFLLATCLLLYWQKLVRTPALSWLQGPGQDGRNFAVVEHNPNSPNVCGCHRGQSPA